jgi:hypothetical protein
VKLIEKIGIGAVLKLLFIVMPLVVTLIFLGLAMWVSQNYGPAYAILPVGLLDVGTTGEIWEGTSGET